jgi:hypothetical protein
MHDLLETPWNPGNPMEPWQPHATNREQKKEQSRAGRVQHSSMGTSWNAGDLMEGSARKEDTGYK